MPMGEGGRHKREDESGVPLKIALFYRYWLV